MWKYIVSLGAKWFLGGPRTHPAKVQGKFTFCPDDVTKKSSGNPVCPFNSEGIWTSNTITLILSQNDATLFIKTDDFFSVYVQLQMSFHFKAGFSPSTPDCVSKSPPFN